MATGYKNDQDEKQSADERYNPSTSARDLYNQENDAIEGYDRKNDGLDDHPINSGDASGKSGDKGEDTGKNINEAKDAEENPMNFTGGGGNKKQPFDLKTFGRKKGPLFGLIALLGGGGFLITGFTAPAMLLMQITDIFTNNFNDAHTSITVRTNANIAHKISHTRNSFSETTDGKCGIRCKHTTMSDATVRNLEARGFEITPKEAGKFNRRIVQTMRFPDGTIVTNGNEFKTALKDPVRAASFYKVFNSKTAFFLNTKFGSMLKSKLGINKAYKLAGDSKEKFNESFRRSIGLPATSTADPNLTPQQQVETDKRYAKIAAATGRLSGPPTNFVEATCFGYNVSRGITAGLKVAKYSAAAAYVMTFFNAAHKLKAADGGGIEPLVVSELGNILTWTDPNKTKEDGSPNELYGLSATDSYGYKAAAYGDTGAMPAYAQANSMESSGILGVLATLSALGPQNATTRAVAHETCKAATNDAAVLLQCGPTLLTGPGYLACVGGSLVGSFFIGLAITAALPLIFQIVIDSNLNKIDENTKGALAGDIMYPGSATILGGHASSYGMKAGTTDEIKEYIALGNEVREQDIAIAKIEAKYKPFDLSNQYSFTGSLARNLNIAAYTNTDLTRSATLVSSLIPRSLAVLTTTTNAGTYMPVAENKANQYSISDSCPALKSIGVAGDAYCMPAYTKNTSELNADIEANLNYMYNGGYINGDTGEPRTDTPEGKTFQKYLDYCVFRTDALGETSESLESGEIGDYEWYIGANCNVDTVAKTDDVKNFRIYAMDEPINATFNGEESVLKSSTAPAENPGGGNGSGENSGNVDPDGWAFPTTAGAPLTQGYHGGHLALDIGSDPNNRDVPIYSMRDGVVTSIGDMPPPYIPACASPTGTIQQAVIVEHMVDGQKFISAYHHVQSGKFPFSVGSKVKAGDRIATMGNTGCSFGQHLHVELWRNSIHGGGSTVDLGAILY